MTAFPVAVLGLKAEILLNGTWTDITGYTYSRNPVVITSGRQDEASTLNPSQATLTLDNRDGRFSTSNTSGAYFPFLVRNTQLRISVSASSAAGIAYSGYRFWGEVSSWPPQSDPSATDIYVDVTASGIWRRLQQGTAATVGPPVYRYYSTLPTASQPVVYWPCEDGSTSASFASGISGGSAMTWTGTPGIAADSTSFKGSNPLAQLNGSAWTGPPGGNNLVASPATYAVAGTDSWLCPGDVTSLTSAEVWGSGSGGGAAAGANLGGTGGGGGEYAKITSVAVTPGSVYSFTVPAGGSPAASGADTSFSGDSATVTAHGASGSTGGTGSAAATHHNGGSGGGNGGSGAGGGGGGSGGSGAAGNNGAAGNSGGAGGSAVTGGGPGGSGGGNILPAGNAPVSGPGGGGGAEAGTSAGPGTGGGGYAGQVKLTYTTSLLPAANVLRFLLSVPVAGGTNGAVVARVGTGGTVATMDVTYGTGGTLKITGKASGGGTLFTHTSGNIANGVPMMVSCELTTSGANVAWAFKYIKPGDTSATSISSGTLTTASVGLMSGNLLVNVSGTETTAVTVGHVSLQYALNSLDAMGVVINGHDGEYAADRFTRLCTETGIASTLLSQVYDNLTLLDAPGAWWKLNDLAGLTAAADSSGGGNPGTATSVTFGGTNEAVAGNTSASFASASPSSIITSYNPALSAVTVEGWVNLNSLSQSGNPRLLANSNTTSDHKGFSLGMSGTTPQVSFGNNSTSATVTAGSPLAASGWAYLAGTWNGTTVTLYVNGVSAGTAALSGSMPAGAATGTGLGWNPATSAAYLNGLLAECAVYPVVLTGGDIAARYAAAAAPSTSSTQMGPQADDTLGNLFQSVEDADRGLLFEPRDKLGLGYRTRQNMQNQAHVMALDYASFHLSPPLMPAADDQLIRNDVTVTRNNGSSARYALTSGAMSTQNPPSGVGDYSYTPTVFVFADSQLANMALWIVTVGTATDYRFPQVNVELSRSAVASLFAAVPVTGPGDYFQITTPPSWLTAGTVKQLAFGFHETLSQFQWSFQFNSAPEAPWEGAGLPSW